MKKNFFALTLLSGIWFSGCYYDNYQKAHPAPLVAAACDSSKTISFANDVEPIFASTCLTGCHSSAAASTGGGGVILDTWSGVKRPAGNGQLMPAIDHSQANGNNNIFWMPTTGGQLSACQIGKIRKWVNAGYPNN